MANRTSFDLNKSMSQWKHTISKELYFTKANIDELECHLLDEINNLNELGLSNEESFLLATRRIGEIKFLGSEYRKVNKKVYFINKILPYLKGILIFLAFTKSFTLLTTGAAAISQKLGIDLVYLNAVSIVSLIIITIAVSILVLKAYKLGEFATKSIQIPILVGIVLISEGLTIFIRKVFITTIGITHFGQLQLNLSIYGIIIIFGIMVLSCIASFESKKNNRAIV